MSEQNTTPDQNDAQNDNAEAQENLQASELDTLKARADMMGISYHPSIGVDKLRDKINARLSEQSEGSNGSEGESQDAEQADPAVETESQRRGRLRREASELVRIRVTCMNPLKREHEGEIFTAGNAVVGTFKKYVPFNAEEGWHVPRIIYKQLIQRECQIFKTVKDSRGNKTRKGMLIKEFGVEVLPALTQKELDEMARRQAMAGNVS